MRKDRAAYEKIYELIRPVVKDKTVLELATGTGLIAKHIVKVAARIEATDASPKMIAEAKRGNCSAKLHFSVQDMFSLPYASKSFDVVIVSNALHIVAEAVGRIAPASHIDQRPAHRHDELVQHFGPELVHLVVGRKPHGGRERGRPGYPPGRAK